MDRERRPRLAKKARLRWDERDGKHLLLYPERGLSLNAVGARIVELCDGAHSVGAMIATLRAEFPAADGERIEREVGAFLDELVARALLDRE